MSTRITKRNIGRKLAPLEPRKMPLQERSKDTVHQILVAAAQVFEELGYAAGTTNRIAERAGVSIGTLYQYFPNKESVAAALLEEHMHETTRSLHEWVGHIVSKQHGLRDALQDYVRGVMAVHEERPRLQHILLEEAKLPERLHGCLLQSERDAVQAMAGLIRLFTDVTAQNKMHAAYFVIHTVECLTHRYVAHPNEAIINKEDFMNESVRLLEAYLTLQSK